MITGIHTTVTTSTVTTMTMDTHTIMITSMDMTMTMDTRTIMITSTDIHTMIAQTQTYPGLLLMKMTGLLMDTLTVTTHTQQMATTMTMDIHTITITYKMDIYTWIEITFATDKR